VGNSKVGTKLPAKGLGVLKRAEALGGANEFGTVAIGKRAD